MKKTVRLLCILLAAMLMLPSCNININGSYVEDDYLYVKGTAVKNKTTGLYEFASADIEIDNKNITNKLVPVESTELRDPMEENVLFKYQHNRFSFIRYESKPKAGYVFDEWKVKSLADVVEGLDDYSDEYKQAVKKIKKAEDYLNETTTVDKLTVPNRYNPTLEMLDVDILPYIYAEYNKAPVVVALVEENKLTEKYEGNGTFEKPYTLDEFRLNYGNSKEINLIVRVKDTLANNDLSKFFNELSRLSDYPRLNEIHIKLAKRVITNADIGADLDRFKSVELENISLGNITLAEDSKTNWKFKNCHFDSLTVGTKIPVILENCKVDNLRNTPGSIVIKR